MADNPGITRTVTAFYKTPAVVKPRAHRLARLLQITRPPSTLRCQRCGAEAPRNSNSQKFCGRICGRAANNETKRARRRSDRAA